MENNLELFFVGGVGEDFRVGVSQNESQGFFFGRGGGEPKNWGEE